MLNFIKNMIHKETTDEKLLALIGDYLPYLDQNFLGFEVFRKKISSSKEAFEFTKIYSLSLFEWDQLVKTYLERNKFNACPLTSIVEDSTTNSILKGRLILGILLNARQMKGVSHV